MKHWMCVFLLSINYLVCAEIDVPTLADKSMRMGRFSYEDSFDENLVTTVINNSSAVVKKNIMKLLYPPKDQEHVTQRLLLLGGVSNARTTAIAKAIALRCGYEYYVIEAATLLREYRAGRQMLLCEMRPILQEDKPIAIIITELPEMADYSGLLASTLWLLFEQCAHCPDVLVIATSAFHRGQLSQDVKEQFGADIISVSVDKSVHKQIKHATAENNMMNWLLEHQKRAARTFLATMACGTLIAVYLCTQILPR